jgi:Holliday junction resolvasome RuvABC ATP-dependent DNA helicase subunit
MADGDVLIIDEIHQLVAGGKTSAEWLLHYLQDGVIVGPRGPEEVPSVTIIGCTTDVGKLPKTVRERFLLQPQLVPYTDEEAVDIVGKLAERIFCEPLPLPRRHDLEAIAVAASKNSRVAKQILTAVRDIALATDGENWHGKSKSYDLTEPLEWLGLSPDGLTRPARRILASMVSDFNGEPAGAAALRETLGEPGGLEYHESLLLEKGLIARTKAGRVLLPAGIRRARHTDVLTGGRP